jgi:hypothetical protein
MRAPGLAATRCSTGPGNLNDRADPVSGFPIDSTYPSYFFER